MRFENVRMRWIAGACVLLLSGGCDRLRPLVETTVFEKQIRLRPGVVEKVPFEVRAAEDLRVELVHLSCDRASVMFMDKQDMVNFEEAHRRQRTDVSYYTRMSRGEIVDRFDSGWQALRGAAVYTVALWAKPKQDQTARITEVTLRVTARAR